MKKSEIRTVADARAEKNLADARADYQARKRQSKASTLNITIKGTVRGTGDEVLDAAVNNEFVRILGWLNGFESVEAIFNSSPLVQYFEIGHGGSHVWIKQVGYLNEENLVLVTN